MNILSDLARSDADTGSLGRHALLLASLISLLVALPILQAVPGGALRFSILLSFVLTAAVYVNSPRRWTLFVAIAAGGGAIATVAYAEATGSMGARIMAGALGLGLLSMTTLMMLNTLVRAERVSQDTIVGGICVYLMIGLCFAMAYTIVVNIVPDSLIHLGEPLGTEVDDSSSRSAKILYFSFVTLTTLGYGDITPSGEIMQMLVTGEAIIGQLYVAIFIARLMALYIVHERSQRESIESSPHEEDR